MLTSLGMHGFDLDLSNLTRTNLRKPILAVKSKVMLAMLAKKPKSKLLPSLGKSLIRSSYVRWLPECISRFITFRLLKSKLIERWRSRILSIYIKDEWLLLRGKKKRIRRIKIKHPVADLNISSSWLKMLSPEVKEIWWIISWNDLCSHLTVWRKKMK